MSEDTAYNWFRRARWPETKGKPSCPHCGVTECYVLTRRRSKCRGCRREFSITSRAIFASGIPFRQILAIIALSANGAKGKAALELRREGGQSISRITRGENADCAWDIVRNHVAPNVHIFADEHAAYDELVGLCDLTRVNHQVAYLHGKGVSPNQIKSFFARVRRAYRSVHHRFSVRYLDCYIAELSRREDCSRLGNRGQTVEMLGRALAHPTSRNLCGYWQGNRPPDLVWEPC
nr:IS1595 family transposase [Microvirga makkahensis]